MAYVNTGDARNKTLTVIKGTYSHDYDLCTGFTGTGGTVYPSLSDDGFAQLSERDYETRLREFIDYVYSQETGLATDCPDMTIGSVIYDPVSCPLPSPAVKDENEEE